MALILRFLREYALRFWPYYLLGLLAVYGTNQLTVLVPRFIQQAVDALNAGDAQTSLSRVYLIGISAVGIVVIRTISRLCFFNPGRAVEFAVRNHLVRHLLHLPASFHDTSRVGDLMSRATNDLQNVRALIGFAGLQTVEAAFIIPLTVYQMIALDPTLTAITISLILGSLLVLWISLKTVITLTRENLEQLSALSDHILDTYSSIPVLHGFCAQGAFNRRFDSLNNAYVGNMVIISAIRSFAIPVVSLIGSVGIGIILWHGGKMVLDNHLSIGALVAFSGFIGILVSRLVSFGWTLNVLQRGAVALDRVYQLLDRVPDIPPATQTLPPPSPSLHATGSGYRFEVKNLTFSYSGSDDRGEVLNGLSFVLEPGQTLGIFGATGSGKSSLMHLMARVYNPPPNSIFLNGVDVGTIPLTELRDLIALVPQDPFLFSTTIQENIQWGGGQHASTDASDPQLAQAISLACLDRDLGALSQGLATVVGARGITLSGGQRQRVALARAFYRRFRILLLDDVVAAVDHKTERQLIENIYSTQRTQADSSTHELQTTVIISHRISALAHADQIMVLDKGNMIDIGTHAELLRRPGMYADTWQAQQEAPDDDAMSEDAMSEAANG